LQREPKGLQAGDAVKLGKLLGSVVPIAGVRINENGIDETNPFVKAQSGHGSARHRRKVSYSNHLGHVGTLQLVESQGLFAKSNH
jgi:hypothetical protein